MDRKATSMGRAQTIPFAIDRNDARPLTSQVADGVRQAVVSGVFAQGDQVPSTRKLSRMLGVSEIVARAALRRLTKEGVLEARPRIGCVVRDQGAKQWRKRVIFVYEADETGFSQTMLAESLRKRLNAAGVLFTRSSVERRPDGSYDLSLLDAALARSTDMAFVLYEKEPVLDLLARHGVPFVSIGRGRSHPLKVGCSETDTAPAFASFAAACARAGVAQVVQFGWIEGSFDVAPALAAAGVPCRTRILKPDFSRGKPLAIEEAGFREFRRLGKSGGFSRDTLYFFCDDYLLNGALQALIGTGLKIPDDIRMATIANAGSGPCLAHRLPRIEFDEAQTGEAIAAAALEYLESGQYPSGACGGARWLGEDILTTRFFPPQTRSKRK